MKLGIRELCVFALLLAFLAGAYLLGFKRLQEQRAFYQRDIGAKHAMLASLVASSASVSELETRLTELRNSVNIFERKLPKQKEVDQILSDVWKLGERHSLRAQSVRPLRSIAPARAASSRSNSRSKGRSSGSPVSCANWNRRSASSGSLTSISNA